MNEITNALKTEYFGADDGIAAMATTPEVTPATSFGGRGQAIYTVKTVYTDITIDGIKDPAYDYGVHLSGLMIQDEYRDYYKDRNTNLDIYMIRGQDGRLYIFGHVTDPDLFASEDLFKNAVDECDHVSFYFDYQNLGLIMTKTARVVGYDGDAPYPRRIRDSKVIITDDGYDFECALDNRGKPFVDGDIIGFSFFYRDTNDFVDINNYKKIWTKIPTELERKMGSFEIPPYLNPNGMNTDTLRFSENSVSGKVIIAEEKKDAKVTGELFADILSGASTVGIIGGGKTCPIQTITSVSNIHNYLSRHGARSTAVVECCPTSDTAYDYEAYDYEIIYNNTVRSCGNRLYDSLNANEYAIEFEDNRIFVSAPLEKSAAIVTEKLISLFEAAKNGADTDELKKSFHGKLEDVPCDNVPKPNRFSHIGDVGDNAYLFITFDVNEADLADYRRALEEQGWKLYTQNEMAKIKTFTYTGFGAVITVVFSMDCAEGLASSLRVVVEPAEKTTLPMLEPETYEKKVTPLVSMINPNNLCMVYRLENGEFLILDGGQMPTYRNLYNILMEQSDGHPVIAAWFFSHFHQDHDGSFVTMVEDDECLKNITIKRIIYNYPQKLVSDTAGNRDDQANLRKWQSLLDKTGAQVFQARTGQKYYFSGAELELLWTFEDLVPYNLFDDDTNITCTGYRLTIEGQTHMLLGDTSEDEMRCAYKRMGTYLKSDFVQLAHHGMGSFHSPLELYQFIDADVVFVPGPPARGEAEKWSVANAKETFVRTDGTVTIELPHTAK